MIKYRRFACKDCSFICDEGLGDPENQIKPGTYWEDFPINWRCPICKAVKSKFEEIGPRFVSE